MTSEITQAGEQLLTAKDLARRWQCSEESVKRRGRSGEIPRVWITPQTVRFRLSDAIAYENSKAHRGPISAAEAAAE